MISEVGSAACETWERTEHRRARRGPLEQQKKRNGTDTMYRYHMYGRKMNFFRILSGVMLVSRRVFIDRVFYIGWLSGISETINIYSQMGSIQELA